MKLGSSDISKVYLGTTEVTKAYLGSVVVHEGVNPLPSGYKKMKYIQNATNAYIDTGIKPNQNSVIKMKWYSQSHNYGTSMFASDVVYARYTNGQTTFYLKFGSASTTSTVAYKATHTIEMSNAGITIDGNQIIVPSAADFSSSKNLLLGGWWSGSSVKSYGPIRYYEIEVGDYTLIPCQRESDNKYGVYITGLEEFKSSAGSAEFTGVA